MINKTDLEKHVESNLTIAKIAEIYSVGNTTIRYWLRKYGLKTKPILKSKFSDEEILSIANNSVSFNNFLEKVGSSFNGGAFYHYKERLTKLGFDFNKFLSGGKVKFINHVEKVPNIKKRLRRNFLKKLLDHNNMPYECYYCGISEWRNKKLNLPIHHKDKDRNNNTVENLCYICPNCHSIEHF